MRSKMSFLMPSDSSSVTGSAQKQFLTDYYLAIAQSGGMEESRDWRVELENNPDLQKYLKDLASTNPDVRSISDAEKAKILSHHRDFESLFNDPPDTPAVIPVRPRRVKSQSAGVVAMGMRRQKSNSFGVAAMGLMGVNSSDQLTSLNQIETTDHYKALAEMTRMHAEVGEMHHGCLVLFMYYLLTTSLSLCYRICPRLKRLLLQPLMTMLISQLILLLDL